MKTSMSSGEQFGGGVAQSNPSPPKPPSGPDIRARTRPPLASRFKAWAVPHWTAKIEAAGRPKRPLPSWVHFPGTTPWARPPVWRDDPQDFAPEPARKATRKPARGEALRVRFRTAASPSRDAPPPDPPPPPFWVKMEPISEFSWPWLPSDAINLPAASAPATARPLCGAGSHSRACRISAAHPAGRPHSGFPHRPPWPRGGPQRPWRHTFAFSQRAQDPRFNRGPMMARSGFVKMKPLIPPSSGPRIVVAREIKIPWGYGQAPSLLGGASLLEPRPNPSLSVPPGETAGPPSSVPLSLNPILAMEYAPGSDRRGSPNVVTGRPRAGRPER